MSAIQYNPNTLRRLRERDGLTRAEMARAIRSTWPTIWRAEEGRQAGFALLRKYGQHFGVEPAVLLMSDPPERLFEKSPTI